MRGLENLVLKGFEHLELRVQSFWNFGTRSRSRSRSRMWGQDHRSFKSLEIKV